MKIFQDSDKTRDQVQNFFSNKITSENTRTYWIEKNFTNVVVDFVDKTCFSIVYKIYKFSFSKFWSR